MVDGIKITQFWNFLEKIADEDAVPLAAAKVQTDVNKWAGEDEEDPKVSMHTLISKLFMQISRL